MDRVLHLPGGVRTGGYPKAAPISGPLGCQRITDWDMLWSPARSALRAVPFLKPGQLVSAVPGMYSLTKKVSSNLHRQAHGHARPDAWRLSGFTCSPAQLLGFLCAAPYHLPPRVCALCGIHFRFCLLLLLQRHLSSTLRSAYGEAAWQFVPQSYSLPSELPQWRAWLDEQAAAGADIGPWMLKTAQHLGKGLVLLPGEAAYTTAQQPR